ncbi:DDE family endonuclease [Rhynchospora pubera]|uniref:DDE family endonuclease n=1 Tax=Rhynchospora pubera TaxID=906938 RepID=A0AAV8DA39_9POAL|nr:DDE family endonuclease [Rhynchospora pubera]
MDQSSGKNNKKGNKKDGNAEPSSRNRAPNWSNEQTALLLNLVREEQLAFRVAGPGTFTIQMWERLAIIINSQSVPEREGHELQTRWKTIKYEFYDYKRCTEKTGWGLDYTNHVAYGPEIEWEELKEKNSKLYRCKSKPFEYFKIVDEIVGSNMASGHCAAAGPKGKPLEELLSQSDSSDGNRNAQQEINEFETSMEQSLHSRSGAASYTSSGKRTLEESDGMECDEPAIKKSSKGNSSNNNKGKDVNSYLQIIVDESQRRSALLDKKVNKNETVATKLFRVKKELDLSRQDFVILQSLLKNDFFKDLFLTISDDQLNEWIQDNIESYKYERGLRWAVEEGGFDVPNGRYYLADSGYANTSKFICPFRNHNYHLAQFNRQPISSRYTVPEELYNHRHAQLRNVIERTFGVLKIRFKILDRMPAYKFRKQGLVVMACCIIHNFIKLQNAPDLFLDRSRNVAVPNDSNENLEPIEEISRGNESSAGEIIRNNIKNGLWSQRRRAN